MTFPSPAATGRANGAGARWQAVAWAPAVVTPDTDMLNWLAKG